MTTPTNTLSPGNTRYWTLGLALAAVGYISAVICLADLNFGANDNLTILDFIQHGYPVPYNGIFYTGLLHLAYRAAPSIPWYPVSLYAFHALSLFLWLTLVRRVFNPWWLACFFMLAIFACYAEFLLLMDYTSASVMLCMSTLCAALVECVAPQPSRWRMFGFGLVFMLGVMTRIEGGLGALAFGLPFAIWTLSTRLRPCFDKHQDAKPAFLPYSLLLPHIRPKPDLLRTECIKVVFLAAVFFAPVLGNLALDATWRQVTLTPQEAQYDKFNALRGEILRVTNDERYDIMQDKALLKEIHWDQEEMGYLLNWYFPDERIYTVDALKAIVRDKPYHSFSPNDLIHASLDRASSTEPQNLLLLACLPLLLLGLWRNPWPNVIGLGWLIYSSILVGFMVTRFTFLDRVSFPYEIASSLVSLILAGLMVSMHRGPGRRMELAAGLMAGALLLFPCRQLASESLQIEQHSGAARKVLLAKLQTLNQDYANSVIVIQEGPGLLMEWSNPLHMVWPEFKPINLGWSIFSPRFYEQISALGIQHAYQLVDALVDRPDAYLLGTEGWCQNMLFFSSASDKHSIRVVPKTNFGDGTSLCRLETVKKEVRILGIRQR